MNQKMKHSLFNRVKPFILISISFYIIVLFIIKRYIVLKYYPPICDFVIFLCFFISLFAKETIIQKFARLSGDKLKPQTLIYTRIVTYIWAVFTFLIFIISVWTIFQSDRVWLIFNGIISYILVGVLFGIEYLIRIILKKRKII